MVSIDNIILVFSTGIAGVLMLISGIIILFYARRKKFFLLYAFSFGWLLQSAVWLLISSAHFYYSTTLMSIAFIFHCGAIVCILLFLDWIAKERISVTKFSVLASIVTAYIIFTFLPGSMNVTLDYGVHITGLCRAFQIILLIYFFSLYFAWSFNTWRKAPKELKKQAQILLIGSIFFTYAALSMYLLGSFIMFFNAIGFLLHGVGAFITIMAIRKDPKIIYILPFKAYKLTVFETNSGIALFTHQWSDIGVQAEEIFSGMLQGIGIMLNEFLDKGEMREIHLDEAILLIRYNQPQPVACVLVTTKSTKSLRDGLETFNQRFLTKFSSIIRNYHEVSRFREAKEIINDVFDFVPKYE